MLAIDLVSTDATRLRAVYGCFPTGVTAVCALNNDVPLGMAASSFTSVSIDPPLVSVCVQDSSATWPKLRGLPRFGLSVLAESHDVACNTLSLKEGDRFAGVDWTASPEGAVFVHGASAWLDCSLHKEVPAGDHAIALLTVHRLRPQPDIAPLVFHASRFRRLEAQ
jgi:flavin reductase (DIM6/NTAB) family NADH-FMN oxidoreductase RutF